MRYQASKEARGYGYYTHVKPRKKAFAALPEISPCCRCGLPMWKYQTDQYGKSALHFDHNDTRDGHLGFSHQVCNDRAAGIKAKERREAGILPVKRLWRSRVW